MRVRRCLIAIPAIAGLLIMGAAGASAAPAHRAAHARMMTVTPSTADPWQFENANDLWIVGGTHGEDLTGTTSSESASAYDQYGQGGGWYTYSLNKLCWNTLGGAGDGIGMDSCPSGDTNEWFATPTQNGGPYVWLENADQGLCIWGAGNGKALVLEPCSDTNNRDLWLKLSYP
jgi:hypothetical protein